MSNPAILKMKSINKTFPGVRALHNVDLMVGKGEIHALMGENGAGKSTLIKVLTGIHKPDSGSIELDGHEIQPISPLDAQKQGISSVYQEVNLCPNLSVAENIYIGRQPRKAGNRVDWKTMNQKANELLKRLNINIDVEQQLSKYSVAIQQMIAIARAVDISSKVLVLDEPTSSLDANEVERLYEVMRQLKNQGMAIIFITHFIEQVYEVSDKITVLRNGEYVGTYNTVDLPRLDLISNMIGKEFKDFERGLTGVENNYGDVLLRGSQLGKRGTISPFNININRGEILGLAGLLGSGRTEIARLIFGIDKSDSGVIEIDNEMIKYMYPKKAIDIGMAFCPEDRKVEGIVEELTIRENIVLAYQASKGLRKYISLNKQIELAKRYIELLGIKTPSSEEKIGNLSGGNQQKCILARWLATNPRLLILDEPTRGIDIGSRTEIQKLILSLAKEGITILLISSELEEMVKCCNRVLVLRDRSVIGELGGVDISESNIMNMIANGGVADA